MNDQNVKPTFRDCQRCIGKGHEPHDQFRTCGSCGGNGCHLIDPWPAGVGVFNWPEDPKEAERLRIERRYSLRNSGT